MRKERLPDMLTLARGVLTIAIAACFFSTFSERYLLAYALFIVAALSDFLDGFLARRWGVTSDFGAIFDPLFDKILVLSLFIILAPFMVVHPAIYVILLIRDISTDALRNSLLARGVVVPAIRTAKWKTVMQMVMLNFVLLAIAFPVSQIFQPLAQASGVAAVALSLWSGGIYVSRFIASTRNATASSNA